MENNTESIECSICGVEKDADVLIALVEDGDGELFKVDICLECSEKPEVYNTVFGWVE